MATFSEILHGRPGHPGENAGRGVLDCCAALVGIFIATSSGFELPGVTVVCVASVELLRQIALAAFNTPN